MRIVAIASLALFFACSPKKKPEQVAETSKVAEEVTSTPVEPKSGWDNTDIKKIDVLGFHPFFLQDGKSILYTTETYKGLWIYEIATGSVRQLTDKDGAGFEPRILGDEIVYQVRARLKYLESVSISTGKINEMKDQRMVPQEYVANQTQPKMLTRLASDLTGIELVTSGEVKRLTPQGDKNYIHTSLSPDGEKLLYKVAGLGAFVSDLDGKTIETLGDINNPSWISDFEILFTTAKDDGMQTFPSEAFVLDLKNQKKYPLIVSGESLENPVSNDEGSQIVVNTPDGSIYLITKK